MIENVDSVPLGHLYQFIPLLLRTRHRKDPSSSRSITAAFRSITSARSHCRTGRVVYHAVQSSHLMRNAPRSSVIGLIASLPQRSPLVCPLVLCCTLSRCTGQAAYIPC